jgi:flagellar biosynthetic protein FlhB
MAEESDLERTEEPTGKRLQDARERGQVARSRELVTFSGLLGGGALLLFGGGGLALSLSELLSRGLRFDRREAFDTGAAVQRLLQTNLDALIGLLPLMAVVLVVIVLSSLLISGWVFSGEPLTPQASRLNPFSGIARMFSAVGLVEILKSVLKTVFLGSLGFWFLWTHAETWLQLSDGEFASSAVYGLRRIGEGLIWVIGGLAVVVLIDVPFQLWNFRKELRMTKEEVRREFREQEGDPQIKARIRQLQRAAARRRMMANVPKATVVITNPEHYAVALRYESGAFGAPRLLAKGIDLIALRIREIAAENDIPILEAPPLARAIYAHTELEQEIPAALYTAVAEVLAWVYALEQSRPDVEMPTDIAVPSGMDPLAEDLGDASRKSTAGRTGSRDIDALSGARSAGRGSGPLIAGVGGVDG